MFKHCCCSHIPAAVFLSLAYLIKRKWQMAELECDLGSHNHWLWSVSRAVKIWSETCSMKGHIPTISLHHLPYIKATAWYFTYLSTVTGADRSPCTSHSSFYSRSYKQRVRRHRKQHYHVFQEYEKYRCEVKNFHRLLLLPCNIFSHSLL